MDPVFALSISGPLTDIGAVAGLVAIPGLAVLSLLYFAQAREVKRLREWAGRAPERAQELQDRVAEQAGRTGTIPPQPAQRVTAKPVARPGAAASRPAGAAPATAAAAPGAVAAGVAANPAAGKPPAAQPGAQPAPAGAPAATAKPATAGAAATTAQPEAKPATPQAKPGEPQTKPDSKPTTPPAATPGGGSPKPASPAVPAAGTAAAAAAAKGNASGATAPPPTERPPARPAAAPAGTAAAPTRPPARRAQPLRSSRPSASAGAAAAPPRRGIRARLGRRGAAIVSGILLVLVVGGLLIATQSGGGSTAKPKAQNTLGAPSQGTKPRTKAKPSAATVQRGNTTVAVLNGTTTPGLAATVSDQLSRGGFKRGNVTNAADQQQSTTAVLYAPGYKSAADEIAQLLKLKSVQPIDPGTQAIAGSDAHVVVTVGTDRTQ
ncbi:MAG: hypothetical protein QOJ55_253 [Solirubrobacteraceae bacterium]|nr:hypothetical protein [Solirubrobacteraceae bacterium]MDX6675724.1 hypothetical protein [Solirubrobacteraceae bacterium]